MPRHCLLSVGRHSGAHALQRLFCKCSSGIGPESLPLVFLELGVLLLHYSLPSHTSIRVQSSSENLAQTSCVVTEEGTAGQSQMSPVTVCTTNCNFGVIGQTKKSQIFQQSLPQSCPKGSLQQIRNTGI